MDDILLFLGMLIIFAAVLFIAWLTAKLLGRKMAGASNNKLMRVVETLPLGMDRCLYLIQAGEHYFLFYATRKSMVPVSEIKLDEDALAARDEAEEKNGGFDFSRVFDFYSSLGKKGKRAKDEVDSGWRQEDIGQRPFSGLSDNVQKLRRLNRKEDQDNG